MTAPDAEVLSLGAGVQSTVMLLMAGRGEITPTPLAAVFADTGWEPAAVYRHLEWLIEESRRLGIEVIVTSRGNIRDEHLDAAEGRRTRVDSMPLFTRNEETGKGGRVLRGCTQQYKIRPTRQVTRNLALEACPDKTIRTIRVATWLGITTDEITRVKPFPTAWNFPRYPLIEAGMSRQDCLDWFAEHYPQRNLPRSACIVCPFRSAEEWRWIRAVPEEWQEAVEFDRRLREGQLPGLHDTPYVHSSRLPLAEAPLDTADGLDGVGGGANECSGGCFL